MPNDASLIRFAPNVLVSMMSAPARTYSWCTSATRSGCVMFSASKLLLMKTPLAYNIVPIAPSQTRTRSSRASKKLCISLSSHEQHSRIEPFRLERLGVNQQVRFRDDVESDRADVLPNRVGEFMMVPEQVQPGLHRRQHIVQHRLPSIDP